jgi:hypothetical protein
VYDFGLTESAFWQLTLPKFAAISRRHEERVYKEDYRIGIITSALWNVARAVCGAKDGDPLTPEHFIPGHVPAKKEQSVEEMRKRFMMQFPPRPQENDG